MSDVDLGIRLVGDDVLAPCLDGIDRPYLSLDAAASTAATAVGRGTGRRCAAALLERPSRCRLEVAAVHRRLRGGTRRRRGVRRSAATATTWPSSAATPPRRSTTSRTGSASSETTSCVTTVVEHHANLLPWSRLARCRYVDCGADGTFDAADVIAALDAPPRPQLLAITGASNVTGWLPPLDEIIAAAHERGVPVLVDAAQLAPHRPLPPEADFLAWSGHKMYAPFGAGVLLGPRDAFTRGDPFLAGGGAVDLVDLDEVVWTDPPEREEAGSPNVLGAVALHAAIDELTGIGWPAIRAHDDAMSKRLRDGLRGVEGVRLLGAAWSGRAAGGPVRGRRGPARAGRRSPQRGARHRCAARVLLRPPLSDAPARAHAGGDQRVPRRRPTGRQARHPRSRAGEHRDLDHRAATSSASSPRSPRSRTVSRRRCPTTRICTRATTGLAATTPPGRTRHDASVRRAPEAEASG